MSRPAPAFYEPTAPTPPLPLLTAHTEISTSLTNRRKLVYHTELPRMLRHGVRFAPYPETINSEKLVDAESSLGRRPGGEAGRPGRGGYTLREVFTLKKTKMSTFKAYMSDLCKLHLDRDKSINSQNLAQVQLVIQAMIDKFPNEHLEKFDGNWPIKDMITAHLKYTSSQARANNQRSSGAESSRSRRVGSRT